ncbi:transcriptional regulator [Streptomyces harbinensis]|uniref:Winged helix DNA-binding domain-containing protein n=1 Tax=Streptomyces harbinensis TaxID=1176198 RepID=A0A1I6VBU4_9ACTN|nr:transcriptional regulator [Streptomyces harbinensis]SFT10994.1 Winged helix DNA-binding domain-containing protein [Streptomyces harbinensis]
MSTPSGFDELIHPATRLSVVALLASTEWADFGFIRDSLSLSDSALSKQLHTLEDAGYLDLRKESSGRKRRTRVRLTERGRTAFDGHVAALRAIVEGAAGPAAVTGLGTGTATGPGTDADRAGAAAAPAAVAPAGAEAGR